MVAPVNFLPLVVVLVLLGLVALSPVVGRINRVFRRIAIAIFGDYVRSLGGQVAERKRQLRAAHIGTTYRTYASVTLLYATVLALTGSVLGVYLFAGILTVLAIPPETMQAILPSQFQFLVGLLELPTLTPGELFFLLLVSSGTIGVAAGLGTYWFRWYQPRYLADVRQRKIDRSMVGTIAFIYAMSRGGISFPKIMKTINENAGIYGASAEEMGVAVRDMEWHGTDLLSAMERLAQQTPSEDFQDFIENLTNVLQSGQNLSNFLRDQYERYVDKEQAQQERFLDLLSTLAEGYISLFVVGPLLLITILVVIGLVGLGRTIEMLQAIIYLIIPLSSAMFIIYIDTLTETLTITREETDLKAWSSELQDIPLGATMDTDGERVDRTGMTSDGGQMSAEQRAAIERTNIERLNAYRRLRKVLNILRSPKQTLLRRPERILYLVVPVAVVVLLARLWRPVMTGTLTVRVIDDLLIQSTLFVLGSFALIQELHTRRIRRIDRSIPDFLDRLASVNESGMSFIRSLRNISRNELGPLTEEIDRIERDIEWGAEAGGALKRFERRVPSRAVTRVVTLLTNAMVASGQLGPILRVAADDAQMTQRRDRDRRQEMLTYTLIIYLSFIVFLVIIISLTAVLIPALPESAGGTGSGVAGFAGGVELGVTPGEQAIYELLFFHVSVIQGLISGLVAGQMGEGSLRNGVKHAFAMGLIAYLLFVVVL
ncbi:MAG: type II secretion system F family protein [Halobacteriales archaeon]|nr:type II secretion system F family protein [Halobacteriales archaeon]